MSAVILAKHCSSRRVVRARNLPDTRTTSRGRSGCSPGATTRPQAASRAEGHSVPVELRVPQADPLPATGVVDSNMVGEHDSRRKPFGLRGRRDPPIGWREWHHHRMRSQVTRDKQTLAIGTVLAMGPSSAAATVAVAA